MFPQARDPLPYQTKQLLNNAPQLAMRCRHIRIGGIISQATSQCLLPDSLLQRHPRTPTAGISPQQKEMPTDAKERMKVLSLVVIPGKNGTYIASRTVWADAFRLRAFACPLAKKGAKICNFKGRLPSLLVGHSALVRQLHAPMDKKVPTSLSIIFETVIQPNAYVRKSGKAEPLLFKPMSATLPIFSD